MSGTGDRVEYLARLGGYGTLVATLQCSLLERGDISRAFDCMRDASDGGGGAELVGLGLGFVLSLTTFYILV